MSDGTNIEWTDATWNVINGCSVTSPGCTNCYAMRLAGTRLRQHPSREGLTIDTKAGPVWTGEVRFNEKVLDDPLRWRRPRRIFVCAHGDLFHESVPDEWIDRVFAVMSQARHHTFQVLTKRPERMQAYLSSFRRSPLGWFTRNGEEPTSYGGEAKWDIMPEGRWPLPNVWLGVSAEDQQRADERIPHLLATPSAVRWISAEPLLGPIDLDRVMKIDTPPGHTRDEAWGIRPLLGLYGIRMLGIGEPDWLDGNGNPYTKIDWVVAGGESGASARPMHPDWVRSLRDQCAAAAVAFFFKQWGEWLPCEVDLPGDGTVVCYPMDGSERDMFEIKGSRAIDSSCGHEMWRVGKKLAGSLLDGVEHNGYPSPELGRGAA